MALVACHECKNELSTEAKVCPKCGAPIRKRKGNSLRNGAIVVFVIMGAGAWYGQYQEKELKPAIEAAKTAEAARIAALAPAQRKAEELQKRRGLLESAAPSVCQKYIHGQLHDPTAASYPELENSHRQTRKDGSILVQVEVRGKNAFNATRLGLYDCVVKYDEPNWRLVSLRQQR